MVERECCGEEVMSLAKAPIDTADAGGEAGKSKNSDNDGKDGKKRYKHLYL